MKHSDLLSPSILIPFLEREGIRPKKSLGQNFLIDKNIVDKIIAAAGITKDDTVLEVGSGLGCLTYPLGLRAGRVIAYEIDRRLTPILHQVVDGLGNVEIREDDILSCQMSKCPITDYILVGNLPYYITSRILQHFLSLEHKPKRIVVTVQKEVAERICAKPPDMSLLAVSVQLYGRPKIIARISKNCFFPRPEVDSAVLAFDVEAPKNIDDEKFFALVKAGFAHKRKLLIRNLERGLSVSEEKIRGAFTVAGIYHKARAEEMGVEDWKLLMEFLMTND